MSNALWALQRLLLVALAVTAVRVELDLFVAALLFVALSFFELA